MEDMKKSVSMLTAAAKGNAAFLPAPEILFKLPLKVAHHLGPSSDVFSPLAFRSVCIFN